MQCQLQPVTCKTDCAKGFTQFSSLGIGIFIVIGNNGIGSDAHTASRGRTKTCGGNTRCAHISHRSFVMELIIGMLDHPNNVIGYQFGSDSRWHTRSWRSRGNIRSVFALPGFGNAVGWCKSNTCLLYTSPSPRD